MTHVSQNKRGFTLIEMLVYVSVMLLIAVGLITTFHSLDTVLLKNRDDRALTESASVALERMGSALRGATIVDTGASTLGTSPGVLTLIAGATTTTFSLSGGRVILSENGEEVGPLTGSDVTVDDLRFTHYVGTATELVRVALTLTRVGSVSTSTRTFYSSEVLRGSYE
ncbi:MAG TPA: type II secretion system protein [Candidatus Paceibacterota bacterium]|nr:type II secretion system protein [Candidatus Paceibacterota bacterium]